MPNLPFVVETFSTFPALGRFVARDRNQTIGVGIVIEVTKREKKSDIINLPVNSKHRGDLKTIQRN